MALVRLERQAMRILRKPQRLELAEISAANTLPRTACTVTSSSSKFPPGDLELIMAEAVPGSSIIQGEYEDIQVWRERNGEIYAYCQISGERHWVRYVGVAGYRIDLKANWVWAIPEPNLTPFLVQDTYRRSILPIIQHLLGKESLHASAVLTPDGVVGFCGASMSGKSTLAYGLNRRGYSLWSDDALVLDFSGSSPEVISFPYRLHLRPSSAKFFGLQPTEFSKGPAGPDERETQTSPEALAALFILDPRLDPARGIEAKVARLAPQEAMTGLLRHAHCFSLKNQGRKREMMLNFMTLADQVPVFSAQYVPGFEGLPGLLDRIEHAFGSIRTA